MARKFLIFFISGVLLRWASIGFPSLHDIGSYWIASDSVFVTGLLTVMREEIWIPFTSIKSARLSYPEGFDFAQYHMTDLLHWTFLHILNFFSGTSTFAYNLYFLLGAGLISASMGFLALSLGLSLPLAVAAGLMFSALPFAHERIHHLFLAIYFQVPMIFYVLLKFREKLNPYLLFFFGAVVGLTGIYYAFFSAALVGALLLILVLIAIRGRQWSSFKRPFLNAVYYMSGKLIFIILSLIPYFMYNLQKGSTDPNKRSPQESIIWGLDIENILLPPTSHWLEPYGSIRSIFFSWEKLRFMSDYEGYAEYLGLLSIVGWGLCIYFTLRFLKGKDRKQNNYYPVLTLIAFVCLGLALKYCLGYLFALTVSPQIRSWNRASLFIACAGMLAFLLWVQPYLTKYSNRKTWILSLGIILFFIAETGTIWKPIHPDQTQIDSDMKFSKEIKAVLGDQPLIGIPFGFFPEWRGYSSVETYGNFRYLQFETVHAIFPSVKGTLETTRKMEMFFGRYPDVAALLNYGIAGIVIDRKDFPDNGNEAVAIYSQLKGTKIQSPDGRFYFVSLK